MEENGDQEVAQHFSRVSAQLNKRNNNSFRIADVLELLAPNKPTVSFENRKMMGKILRETLTD